MWRLGGATTTLALWERIVDALTERGVELVPEETERGVGVRWTAPARAKASFLMLDYGLGGRNDDGLSVPHW